MTGVDFRNHVFTAPRERRLLLLEQLQSLKPSAQAMRVLDLGCGTGAQLLRTAEAFPQAVCIGVDISPASIEAAKSQAAPWGGRVSFHCRDYFSFEAEPFDVILADSVLQNITGSTEALAFKLGHDLKPNGVLIASMPYDTGYNHFVWASRWIVRALRSTLLERAVLTLAKRMHPDWPPALLRERVPYLYLLPERIDGQSLREQLAQFGGLMIEHAAPMPHASAAQPKHRLLVFRKTTA